MRAKKQENRVHRYLLEHHSVTRAVAMNELGVANLPEVIRRLRNRGIDIESLKIDGINRFGEEVTYVCYVMPEKSVNME